MGGGEFFGVRARHSYVPSGCYSSCLFGAEWARTAAGWRTGKGWEGRMKPGGWRRFPSERRTHQHSRQAQDFAMRVRKTRRPSAVIGAPGVSGVGGSLGNC